MLDIFYKCDRLVNEKGVVRQNDGQLPNYGLHKKITAKYEFG